MKASNGAHPEQRPSQSSTNRQLPLSASTRPSTAIQGGAERLYQLLATEQDKLTRIYHSNLKTLEKQFLDYKTLVQAEAAALAEKDASQTKHIQDLTQDLDTARLQPDAPAILAMKAENEAMKRALDDADMVLDGDSLRFKENSKTERVVRQWSSRLGKPKQQRVGPSDVLPFLLETPQKSPVIRIPPAKSSLKRVLDSPPTSPSPKQRKLSE